MPKITNHLGPLLFIGLISSFLCFYQLGRNTFGNGDQTVHARVVQDMFHAGTYLSPKVYDKPYYNKPPLKMWLSQVPLLIWGESNFSYRAIDGLCGVLMAVLLYVICIKLFQSRILAFFSSLFLLSCSLFYYGHGVRNAVQDSLMNLFVMAALYMAYSMIEELIIDNTAGARKRAIWGAIFTSGAILCKGLGGAIAFPIIGIYVLISGNALKIIRNGWHLFLIIFIASFVPLLFYILLQGEKSGSIFRMLFVSEGLKRAVKGYHYVGHVWYYWRQLVENENAVPVVSFLIGMIFFLKDWALKRGRPYLFVFSWAFVPILFYQCMKSKLPWYVIPSLGGLSIICAYGVYALSTGIVEIANKKEFNYSVKKISLTLFFLTSLLTIGYLLRNFSNLTKKFDEPYRPDTIGSIAESRERHKFSSLLYDLPKKLAMHESFYFRMMNSKSLDKAGIQNMLKSQNENIIVFSDLDKLAELSTFSPPTAIQSFPPKFERTSWIGAISYGAETLKLPGFLPWCQKFIIGQENKALGRGWLPHSGRPGGRLLRGIKGSKARMEVDSNFIYRIRGAIISLNMSSTLKANESALVGDLYLNERNIGSVELKDNIERVTFFTEREDWDIGKNILTFSLSRKDGSKINQDAELFLAEDVEICPQT